MARVLIFGARSEIAMAIAHEFARHEVDIHLVARETSSLLADQSDIQIRHGVHVELSALDCLNVTEVDTFVASATEAAPDVVISVLGKQEGPHIMRDDAEFIRGILDANFFAPAYLLEKFANGMVDIGVNAVLVCVSSVAGDRGRQSNYTYGASKAGMTEFLSGLRNRLYKTGIHVLTVKPGIIDTRAVEGLDFPRVLRSKPEVVAKDVYRAVQRRRNVIYSPWYWRWIMLIIRLLPEPLFKRLNL